MKTQHEFSVSRKKTLKVVVVKKLHITGVAHLNIFRSQTDDMEE